MSKTKITYFPNNIWIFYRHFALEFMVKVITSQIYLINK
jgi:hypothetical protein